MAGKAQPSRVLAMNTTVEGETYAAGTVPPPEVAAKIDNPKSWAGPADDYPVSDGQPEDGDPVSVPED